jgi:hypothetical protein
VIEYAERAAEEVDPGGRPGKTATHTRRLSEAPGNEVIGTDNIYAHSSQ